MFVEGRYSEPVDLDKATGTKLSPSADVCRKVALLRAEINAYGLREENCMIVISAFQDPANQAHSMAQFRRSVLKKPRKNAGREVQAAFQDFDQFRGTVFAMDQAALRAHMGPTLSRPGSFVLDYVTRHI